MAPRFTSGLPVKTSVPSYKSTKKTRREAVFGQLRDERAVKRGQKKHRRDWGTAAFLFGVSLD